MSVSETISPADQFARFPGSRYMGSKHKILPQIWAELEKLSFERVLDAFGGSNVVGYFLKTQGKQVISNDFMASSYLQGKALIENSSRQLSPGSVQKLLTEPHENRFIQENFKGLYFTDAENAWLDQVRGNIDLLDDEYERAIALAALVRACKKRRPRGVFTYTGDRYNDGRKDLRTSLEAHFLQNVDLYNAAVFANGKNHQSLNLPATELSVSADLVYIDPPYYSTRSDNDYVRRYHFVEGLVKYWEGLEIQEHTKTRKFKSYESPFANRQQAYEAFRSLVEQFSDSIIAISYSSNSLPTKDELVEILSEFKSEVSASEIDYRYSFGNQGHKVNENANQVKEYLIIGQ